MLLIDVLVLLLGEVCFCNDFIVVYEILVKIGYKDDEGIDNEVCIYFFNLIVVK